MIFCPVRHRVDDDRTDRQVLVHQLEERQLRFRDLHRSIGSDRPANPQYLDRDRQVRAELYVNDTIDRFSTTAPEYCVCEVGVAMIDHVMCAGRLARVGILRITRRGDDRRTGPARPLHGVVADTSGTTGHEDCAALDVAVREDGTMRGHCGDAKACADVETGLTG